MEAKGRDSEKHWCERGYSPHRIVASQPGPGIELATQLHALDWASKLQPFGPRAVALCTEQHRPGLFHYKKFFCPLIFRERDVDVRETLIDCLPYVPQQGIELTTYVCALTGNQTHHLLLYRMTLQPTATWAGLSIFYFEISWGKRETTVLTAELGI